MHRGSIKLFINWSKEELYYVINLTSLLLGSVFLFLYLVLNGSFYVWRGVNKHVNGNIIVKKKHILQEKLSLFNVFWHVSMIFNLKFHTNFNQNNLGYCIVKKLQWQSLV